MTLNRIAALMLLTVTLGCSQQVQQGLRSTWLPLESTMDRIDGLIANENWLEARATMDSALESLKRDRSLYGSQAE